MSKQEIEMMVTCLILQANVVLRSNSVMREMLKMDDVETYISNKVNDYIKQIVNNNEFKEPILDELKRQGEILKLEIEHALSELRIEGYKMIKTIEQTDEREDMVTLTVPKERPVEDFNGDVVEFIIDDGDFKRNQ